MLLFRECHKGVFIFKAFKGRFERVFFGMSLMCTVLRVSLASLSDKEKKNKSCNHNLHDNLAFYRARMKAGILHCSDDISDYTFSMFL